MPIKRLTPMFPALSAKEVRAHLRQVGAEEDSLIEGYLLASQQDIETCCERAMTAAKFRIVLPCFPGGGDGQVVPLPFDSDSLDHYTDGSSVLLEIAPALKIAAVAYYDGGNVLQSYTASNLFSDAEPAELRQALNTAWPATYSRRDAVNVSFWAGQIIPITLDTAPDQFVSGTGYPFVNNDEIVLSKSGNSNEILGDVAVLPTGVTAQTTYFVVNVAGNRFQIAATSGGAALPLAVPTTSGQVIDLLFAGVIDPWHRLALLQMTGKAFGERCPQGGCVCSEEEFDGNPMLRRLKWRSPVQFV